MDRLKNNDGITMASPKPRKAQGPKQKKGSAKDKKNIVRSIGQYLKEVRSEFRKVMWPNRSEVVTSTIVVFVTVVFFVTFTFIFDLIFSGTFNRLLPLIGG